MNPTKLIITFAVTGFSLALIVTGCGSSTGGGSGTGGSSATGGSTGTGGSATGGTPGTGGIVSTGGITGTGGIVGTGGAPATGGTTGIAGAGGKAGSNGAAGSTGSGGTAGAAGHPAGGAAGGAGHPAGGATATGGSAGGASGSLTLTSPDQAEGAAFGTMYTCAAMNGTFGSGVNPELDWAGVPTGTMSFAITFIDTKLGANMATGQHWAIWDIPATVTEFPKGTTTLTGTFAAAMQSNKYLAPCPSGNDTYEYTLYALSSATLSVTGASGSAVSNSAGVAKVLAALKTVTPLATATLHGTSGPMGKS